MQPVWPDLPRPFIFAHRGASAHAPENTLASFQKALEDGARSVEFDVKLSSDGKVVVIHDQTVNRTTSAKGDVRTLCLDALRELDAGSWFDVRFKGEHIPSLDEVFAAFGKKLYMNVELTNYATPGDALVERVAPLVVRHGLQKQILFSSFSPTNLQRAAQLLPDVPRGLLISPLLKGFCARVWGWKMSGYQAVHPFFLDVTSNLIRRVHEHGARVHVWTVNNKKVIRRMVDLGADGIFTDDPALALRILEGKE